MESKTNEELNLLVKEQNNNNKNQKHQNQKKKKKFHIFVFRPSELRRLAYKIQVEVAKKNSPGPVAKKYNRKQFEISEGVLCIGLYIMSVSDREIHFYLYGQNG